MINSHKADGEGKAGAESVPAGAQVQIRKLNRKVEQLRMEQADGSSMVRRAEAGSGGTPGNHSGWVRRGILPGEFGEEDDED